MCTKWYHGGCEGVSHAEFKYLSEGEVSSRWFCRKCDGEFVTLREVNIILKEDYRNVKEENKNLKTENEQKQSLRM